MKIFSAAQIRACDAYTIHASGISSFDLMERAAGQCADWIANHIPKDKLFVVLCGTGNNGGDGLAIARMLHRMGYGAKAFLLRFGDALSPDCSANLDQLRKIDPALVEEVQPDTFITDIPEHIIIIDAILGTGMNREPQGWLAEFIKEINQLPNRKIAIDIPSGMPADSIPGDLGTVMQVTATLSFQFYKRSFLHAETGRLAGKVHILDINLSDTFIHATHTHYMGIDKEKARNIYQRRSPFSHKGTLGTAMVVGGSYGMIGSIALAAKAASRAGAGKVKAVVPKTGYDVIQSYAPECLCATSGDRYINQVTGWQEVQAVGIGPGMGMEEDTVQAFIAFIDACKKPVVIDADGLNILAKHPEVLKKLPAGSILTPHPKEFERLFGKSGNSMMQVEQARTQAMKYNIHIVLKGRYTAVVTNEGECWYNFSGNAGLATGGAGDVLTGILTGLLAQGYEPAHTAMLGVFMHGLAAEKAMESQSEESLVPQDVIDHIGRAYKILQ